MMVLKHVVRIDGEPQEFLMRADAPVLAVGCQAHEPQGLSFWFIMDPTGKPLVHRTFRVVGTGQEIGAEWHYRGTALMAGGRLVWHLMERP